MDRFDVIVIGQGVAGMTAAREAASAGLRVMMFEATLFGGLITNVNALDPSPDPAIVMGADYAASLLEAAIGAGVENVQEAVDSVERQTSGFRVRTGQSTFEAAFLVIASGARFRALGVPGEEAFAGRGVSNCADCDGPLLQRAEAVVVGGGDSALQEALVLAEYCSRVHIVHHGAAFSGRADLVERVAAEAKIVSMPNAEIERIDGGDTLERVTIRNLGDQTRVDLACNGVFPYIGLLPSTEFLPEAFTRDAGGHLTTNEALETAVPGAFAIGAVRAAFGGTLTDAINDGRAVARRVAALAAGQQ